MAAVTRLGLHGGPRGLYGSFEGRNENVVAESFTGGWATKAYRQHQSDERKKRQRIALGIIPDDTPEADKRALIDAAEKRVEVLARQELKQLAKTEQETQRLEILLADIMQAQAQAEAEERLRQLEAIASQREVIEGEIAQLRQKNRNAEAVLIMLSLT